MSPFETRTNARGVTQKAVVRLHTCTTTTTTNNNNNNNNKHSSHNNNNNNNGNNDTTTTTTTTTNSILAIFYPLLKYIFGCVWLCLQAQKGNVYFTLLAGRVEYGNYGLVGRLLEVQRRAARDENLMRIIMIIIKV